MQTGASSSPQRRRLNVGTIVDAAIRRVELHGAANLSARKLARDLGCEAMSLYHHVPNMDVLQDAIVDRLLASVPPSTADEHQTALVEEAKAYLAVAGRYPRTFPLVATRTWRGEAARATAARAVHRFELLGHAPKAALARARALGAYLNGAALAISAWRSSPDIMKAGEVGRDLEWGLRRLVGALAGK